MYIYRTQNVYAFVYLEITWHLSSFIKCNIILLDYVTIKNKYNLQNTQNSLLNPQLYNPNLFYQTSQKSKNSIHCFFLLWVPQMINPHTIQSTCRTQNGNKEHWLYSITFVTANVNVRLLIYTTIVSWFWKRG